MPFYDKLEDAIIERLSPLTPAVEVEALPDTAAKMSRPFTKPRVTVAYRSSEFDREVVRGLPTQFATSTAVQDEYASVEVVIQARTVRGDAGCHAIKNAVFQLLFGWEPKLIADALPHWSKLTVESYRFVEQDEKAGLFTYAATFITRSMSVPFLQIPDTPLLNELTFNVDNG